MGTRTFTHAIPMILCLLVVSSLSIQGQYNKELQSTSSDTIPAGTVPITNTDSINIAIKGNQFIDATGRTLFLRGVNLGGSTKVPYTPYLASHINDDFFNGKDISFVGRPFPLDQADEHFARLKAWGFQFLRFLITWEAIEHEGPGIYDQDYLNYVRAIIQKANNYGINVMIDPHQDVWSRFTGGDGAPLWTFEVAGMDVSNFQETGAAFIHNVYGDPFPKMIWYTNYFKLGAATMFTLFYGGNQFAPLTKVDNIPIQDYLQDHYINAMLQLAEKVKDLPNVVGFELMNEPSAGYIGIEDLQQAYQTDIIGDAPTPLQGMLLGAGLPQSVKNYRLGAVALKENKPKVLNPSRLSVWKNQHDLWQQNGVYKIDENGKIILLKADYFSTINGHKVDFNKQFYEPFAEKYAHAILKVNSAWFICVDNVLFPYPHELPELKSITDVRWINGSHWYDDVTLIKKKYMPYLGLKDGAVVFGKRHVQNAFEATLREMINETQQQYGEAPSLLGEFGIPFDMNKAKAYKTGKFKKQTKALNRSFSVAESNLLNYTLWNYTADNTNESGDLWNGEDLSIYSNSQKTGTNNINEGGRALSAAIRPYPKKINGTLTNYSYDYKTKTLQVTFETSRTTTDPTEIILPTYIYNNKFLVYSGNGSLAFDQDEQTLLFIPEKSGKNQLIVKPQQ